MTNPYPARQVTPRVHWVGAVDWGIRDFHGYSTERGSTYNAYLIVADKTTLIDTVKAPFADELLYRIASVIDPTRIDYIVSNHSEMDHSGALPAVIEAVKPEKVFASTVGARTLSEHFRFDNEIAAVKDGDTLDLGGCHLTFMETRMLHWPDSMFSYLAEDRLLFSSDAFGMHLASSGRFDDEVGDWELEAKKYFANILLPYAPLVEKLLAKVAASGLAIDVICPDHGPIWRRQIPAILDRYARWARRETNNKAVVTYDTMWHSTARMARAIAEGIGAGGSEIAVMPLGSSHRSSVVLELMDAGALVVGSPTLNNNMFPTVADLVTYVRGLRPRPLIGAAFGSYGWSGEGADQVHSALEDMKATIAGDPIKARYVPDEPVLADCFELGQTISRMLSQE